METMIYVVVVTDTLGVNYYTSHDSLKGAMESACFMMQTDSILKWEKVWLDEDEVSYFKSSFMGQTANIMVTRLNKKY